MIGRTHNLIIHREGRRQRSMPVLDERGRPISFIKLRREIDAAAAQFWRRRGLTPPPSLDWRVLE